jgi:hypothetical protein
VIKKPMAAPTRDLKEVFELQMHKNNEERV